MTRLILPDNLTTARLSLAALACGLAMGAVTTAQAETVVQSAKAIGILEPNDTDGSNLVPGYAGAAPADTQKIAPVPLMMIDRGFWKDNGFVFDKAPDGIMAPKGHLKTWSKDSYKDPLNSGWGGDHGTFVAGIIGGALPQKGGMSTGFARLTGTAKKNAMYLCDYKLESTEFCLSSYLPSLSNSKPQFVNVSLGCDGGTCASNGIAAATTVFDDAIWSQGVLVVAAAGNEGRNRHNYNRAVAAGVTQGASRAEWPRVGSQCGSKNALCVGAVTNEAAPRYNIMTNDGPTDDGRPKPDIFAIGSYQGNCFQIKGSKKPDITKPCTRTGTSMAAPMVTATLATVAAQNPDWQGKPHIFKTWAILAATRDATLSNMAYGARDGRSGWLSFAPALKNQAMTDITHGDGTTADEDVIYRLPNATSRRNRIHFVLGTIEKSIKNIAANISSEACRGFEDTDPDCRYVFNELHLAAYAADGTLLRSTERTSAGLRDTVRHISFCLNDPRLKDSQTVTVRMLAKDVPDPARYSYKWAMGGKVDFSEDCR